jgi:hypothetical protein
MLFLRIKGLIDKRPYIIGLFIILSVFTVYISALDNYLMRDDFEWLNESYEAVRNPAILLKKINSFFRPMVKLSYLTNHFFFKTKSVCYNFTTISIHLLNVFLLFLLIYKISCNLRNTKPKLTAFAVALGFGTSPMFSEVTLWAAGRPDSILLVFILLIMNIFVKKDTEKKTKTNDIFIIIFTIFAAFSKETWILLPFLILSYQIILKKMKLLTALKEILPILIIWLSYLIYFIIFPLMVRNNSPVNYSNASLTYSIKKFGYLIYKYFGLGDFYSGNLYEIIFAFLFLTALTIFLIFRKSYLSLWGMSWMLITIAISLPIYYTPSRYNYLPLTGFWIMLICFVFEETDNIIKKLKLNEKTIYTLIGILFIIIILYQSIMLQWEIRDYRFQSKPYKKLAQMYLKIKDKLPMSKPIVFIDNGKRKAVNEAIDEMIGYKKILFVRSTAIWQLVYLQPLHNFLTKSYNTRMVNLPKNKIKEVIEGGFDILYFSDYGFSLNNTLKKRLIKFYNKYKKLPYKVQMVEIKNIDE